MKTAAGISKHIAVFRLDSAISSTTDPAVRFTAKQNMTMLALRVSPLTEFDRTTGDETYVASLADDGTKISTDNGAVTTAAKTSTIESTFAAATRTVAAESIVTITLTLGGTTPIIPAGSVIELEWAE